jgi:hypothetical protein
VRTSDRFGDEAVLKHREGTQERLLVEYGA